MIVDLDQWIQTESAHGEGDRLFPHDLFISHRRFDRPQEFVSRLVDTGTQVTWDCDLDLRDRRVMHAVGRAMRRSRYLALLAQWLLGEAIGTGAKMLGELADGGDVALLGPSGHPPSCISSNIR